MLLVPTKFPQAWWSEHSTPLAPQPAAATDMNVAADAHSATQMVATGRLCMVWTPASSGPTPNHRGARAVHAGSHDARIMPRDRSATLLAPELT